MTFNKFHAVKGVNEALEEVRREEQKIHHERKRSRYLWLRNPEGLRPDEEARLEALLARPYLKTGRAYRSNLAFQGLYEEPMKQRRIT